MITKCSALIQIEPQNAKAYLINGMANSNLENYSDSIQELSIAIKLLPDDSTDKEMAYMYRALAKNAIHDYLGSILDSSILIAKHPNNNIYYSIRGESKKGLKDYRGAIQDLTYSINLHYNSFTIFWSRGDAKFKMEDYEGAIEDFSHCINLMESVSSDNTPITNTNITKTTFEKLLFTLNKDEFYKFLSGAYSSRAFSKLEIHDTYSACLDFSKAGELGDNYAYKMIQKYCGN